MIKSMPSHWISRAESRGYKVEDMLTKKFKCERPEVCGKSASSIHHIRCSFHGKKSLHEGGHELVALCITHHEHVHKNNNLMMREYLLDFVKGYENIKN